MPNIECPFRQCTWTSGEVSDGLASQMLGMHARDEHPEPVAPPAPTPTTSNTQAEKVRRPTLSAAGTGEDWAYFIARWDEYTAATGIHGKDRVLQLLECCEEDLRKDLTRNAGHSLADTPENEVLQSIKVLAVREENIMVAQNELWNMHQDHNESVRSFGARLRGQAGMCLPCHVQQKDAHKSTATWIRFYAVH